MAELVSQGQMAKLLGISSTALNKAVKSGRVKVAARDGKNGRFKKYDPEQTISLYNASTDPSKQRGGKGQVKQPAHAKSAQNCNLAHEAQSETSVPTAYGTEAVAEQFQKAKTLKEVSNAQLAKIKLDEAKKQLIDKATVEATIFDILRTTRDQLLAGPSRFSTLVEETEMGEVEEFFHDIINDLTTSLENIA